MGAGGSSTPRRALVLGGGGISGIAWEAGVIVGLLDEGIDVRVADTVIGTSAGAVVGARLLGDPDFRSFAASQASEDITREDKLARELVGLLGASCLRLARRPRLRWLLGLWITGAIFRATTFRLLRGKRLRSPAAAPLEAPDGPPNLLHARIGRLARATPTVSEWRWREIIADLLGDVHDWPDRLRITAIDAEDGRLVAFDATRPASLRDAVAASTSVPALFPPIVIAGRPYVDGGITSETNCLLASDHDEILVLAPLDRPILAREVEQLRARGARVSVLMPSPAARKAVGSRIEVLDPIRRAASGRAGYADGRSAAGRLPAAWREEHAEDGAHARRHPAA